MAAARTEDLIPKAAGAKETARGREDRDELRVTRGRSQRGQSVGGCGMIGDNGDGPDATVQVAAD